MTSRELKRMGRAGLLELLIAERSENERMEKLNNEKQRQLEASESKCGATQKELTDAQAKIEELEKALAAVQADLAEAKTKLESDELAVANAGSIAEAALQVSGIFAIAQKAADQYLANVERMQGAQQLACEKLLAETQQKCARMEAETQQKCAALEAETRAHCQAERDRANREAANHWSQLYQNLQSVMQNFGTTGN